MKAIGIKTSDKVLQLLKNHSEAPLSGEEIAKELQISRTSIWKAVNKLQNEGYVIQAQQNSGYLLKSVTDSLCNNKIEPLLTDEVTKFVATNKVTIFKQIDSTNTEAKKRLSSTKNVKDLEGTVLVAEKQTAGRGRLGRSFYSPAHNGIYMSIIFKPENITIDTAVMTAAAAVAVCRALKKYNIQPSIKWVNDIFVNEKKVCGILTEGNVNLETGIIDAVILGIGLNVISTNNFSKELQKIAGAVFEKQEANQPDRNELVATILNEVCGIFLHPETISTVMNEYRDNSMVKGKMVTVIGAKKNYEARVIDITPSAHLIIETADGTQKELLSGEVSIKPVLRKE
jgi:BirA family biotin operon repressor/biotin-[acetyl-CoA-carboxylase] ligase